MTFIRVDVTNEQMRIWYRDEVGQLRFIELSAHFPEEVQEYQGTLLALVSVNELGEELCRQLPTNRRGD